jgi:putative acetyltransferase
VHHYTRFLATIRSTISSGPGAFDEFRARFMAHFLPEAKVVPVSEPAHHAHQVGRALLGPFAPIVAQVGEFVIRRALPKDDAQVAAIIRRVMTDFGCTGAGYAIHDKEVDEIWRTYETHNLPLAPTVSTVADGSAMEDVAAHSTTVAPPPLPPLRSAFFVVTRADDDTIVLGGAGIAPLAGGDPAIAELRKMYFLPTARGVGVGQLMIDLCMAEAKKNGFKQLYLETITGMEKARALYARNAFRPLAQPMGNTGHGAACDLRFIRDL